MFSIIINWSAEQAVTIGAVKVDTARYKAVTSGDVLHRHTVKQMQADLIEQNFLLILNVYGQALYDSIITFINKKSKRKNRVNIAL